MSVDFEQLAASLGVPVPRTREGRAHLVEAAWVRLAFTYPRTAARFWWDRWEGYA